MAYLNIPYQNSAAYNAVIGATTAVQLLNRKRYTLGAIEYHKREGNAEQVSFFKSDLVLIEERLTKLAPDRLESAPLQAVLQPALFSTSQALSTPTNGR